MVCIFIAITHVIRTSIYSNLCLFSIAGSLTASSSIVHWAPRRASQAMRLSCVWWPPGRTGLCVCGVYRAVSSSTRTAPNSGCQRGAQTRARPLPRERLARARLSRWTRRRACPERESRWHVRPASPTRCRGSGPARASSTPGSHTTRCARVYYARSSLNVLCSLIRIYL